MYFLKLDNILPPRDETLRKSRYHYIVPSSARALVSILPFQEGTWLGLGWVVLNLADRNWKDRKGRKDWWISGHQWLPMQWRESPCICRSRKEILMSFLSSVGTDRSRERKAIQRFHEKKNWRKDKPSSFWREGREKWFCSHSLEKE